ncbi:MAG: hypothetical protein GY953_42235, partial [bacterium]|nr:hypothetical protein [bacterium]
DRDLPNRRLASYCRDTGIACLDLLEPLRRAEADGATYKPQDTHWNRRGNRVAAREIAGWLRPELVQQ